MKTKSFINDTHNQHFISQAEQRLNSCSIDSQPENAEIFCFDILDKESSKIKFSGERSIKRNMSFRDLFTLSRIGDKDRINFERLFRKYEDGYPAEVAGLLELTGKVKGLATASSVEEGIDLKKIPPENFSKFLGHVKYIYTYKLMNWLRNPYKIKDVLRTFSLYIDHSLDKPGALELYFALTEKNEGEEQYICKTFGVSPKEYRQWIRLLLLFLYSENEEPSSLEGFAEEFFKAPEFTSTILLYEFDERCALLTDTGVVRDSLPEGIATYMNVTKNVILLLQHTKVDGKHVDAIVKQYDLSPEQRAALVKTLQKSISARLYLNYNEILGGYNKICVKAAVKQVFSASKVVEGVTVL